MNYLSVYTSLIIVATILLSGGSAISAPSFLYLEDWEVGDEVIASIPGHEVTEQEAMAFFMLSGAFDPVEFARWRELPAERKESLKTGIDGYFKALLLADRWTPKPENSSVREEQIEDLASRLYAGNIAGFLWGRLVLPREVVLFPEDIYYHYENNPELYGQPATRTVLYVEIPVSDPEAVEVVNAARDKAQALRADAVTNDGLLSALESENSPYADLEVQELVLGGEEGATLPQRALDRLNLMSVAQISNPIQTEDAYSLVELVSIQEVEPEPLREVAIDIKLRLREQFLPIQYDLQLIEESIDARVTNLAYMYEFLDDEVEMIEVRWFELTRGEFSRLYPEVVGPGPRPNMGAVNAEAGKIVFNELAHQWLESLNLADNPLMDEGLRIARQIYHAGDYLRRQRSEVKATPEAVEEYLEENREAIAPTSAKTVWRLRVQPRDNSDLSGGEAGALQFIMRRYIDRMIDEGGRLLEERRLIMGGDSVPNPGDLLTRITLPEDRRISFDFNQLPPINTVNAKSEIEVPYESLELGQFTTPVSGLGSSYVSYFVSEIVESPPVPEETLLELAKLRLVLTETERPAVEQLESYKENGKIEYHPLLDSHGFD